MSLSPYARLAGPLALMTGALITVHQIIMYPIVDHTNIEATMAHPLHAPTAVAYFVIFCLLLLALVAVYAQQAERAGTLGVIGFGAALLGTLALGGDAWFEAFAVPWLGDVAPQALHTPSGLLVVGAFASYVLFASGWALFGLASLWARVFPAAVSLAMVVSGIIGFSALVPPNFVPLGLTLVWLGVWLMRSPAATR